MTREVRHELTSWADAAAGLTARLGTDYRNHRALARPWSRAAHAIVQTWRTIASQGRLNHTPTPKRRPSAWDDAARRMRANLTARRRCRLTDPNTWRFWAAHLPKVHLRYVPKRQRGDRPGR